MNNAPLSNPSLDVSDFAPKAEAVWSVLHSRYAGRISEDVFDHLFARFVFGLTSPGLEKEEPAVHFETCRALVLLKLPPERAHAALHTVPEPGGPWIEGAYEAVERQGIRMGQAIAEQKRRREPFGLEANASLEKRGYRHDSM